MKKVYVIESIWYAESHDDFCYDYDGEVSSILGDEFYDTLDKAWNYVLSLFKKDKPDSYRVDEKNHTVDYNFGDTRTYRVRELTRHK